MSSFGYCILLFSLLFLPGTGSAQTTFSINIRVVDSLTLEPLHGATVVAHKHRHPHITDENGNTMLDSLTGQQVYLHVTYVGYHHRDMLVSLPQFSGDVIVPLCPENFHLHETLISEHAVSSFLPQLSKTYLQEEDLQSRSAQNLGDLLKQVNGMSSLGSAGGIAKPVIRGLSGQRLSVYSGSTRLEGQQWGADHGVEVDILSVDQVEVVKGAATLEYGPDAIGGMIRLSQRPWRKSKGIGGILILQGQSNNLQGASALQLEGSRGNENSGMAFQTSIGFRRAGDSRTPDYVQSNTGFYEQTGQIGLEAHHGKWSGETHFSWYQNETGIFAASHLGNLDDVKQALASDRPLIIQPFTYRIDRPRQLAEHTLANGLLNYSLNKLAKVSLNVSQQVNRRREYDADLVYNSNLQNVAATDLELLTRMADLIYDHRLAFHLKLRAGISWQNQDNTNAGLQTLIPDYVSQSQGAFFMLKRDLAKGSISGGMRFDRRDIQVEAGKLGRIPLGDDASFQGFSGVVNGVFNLSNDWQFLTKITTGFRPPAPNERYSFGLHFGLANFEIGDLSLGSERSVQIEMGLQRKHKEWELEINGYLHQLKNFIYRRPLSNPILTIRGAFPAFQYSACDALMAGGEFSLKREPDQGVLAGLQGSYLFAQNTTHNEPLLFMPANRLMANIGYRFSDWKNLRQPQLNFQFQGVARQDRFPSGVDYMDPPPAYWLAGLQWSSKIKWKGDKAWNFSFGIRNLFNMRYRDYLSRFRYFTDEPGRNVSIQLRIPF